MCVLNAGVLDRNKPTYQRTKWAGVVSCVGRWQCSSPWVPPLTPRPGQTHLVYHPRSVSNQSLCLILCLGEAKSLQAC